MKKAPSVVIGDFDPERQEWLASLLGGKGYRVTRCQNGAETLERCQSELPDALVASVFLPARNGFHVVKALKDDPRTSGIRAVLFVDGEDDYGEHRARLAGADFVLRQPFGPIQVIEALETGSPERKAVLGARARQPAAEHQLGAVLEALEDRARAENPLIEHITDSLTGLCNRAYMDVKLAEEAKKARRFQIPLTCILVGLDDGGKLTEPETTDELRRLLNEIAGLLLCESRDIDHLGRYHDREFLILLPHTDLSGATTMARRILSSIESRRFPLADTQETLTASAGLALFAGNEMERAEELYLRAREALETSQKWGGNRVTIWQADPEKTPRAGAKKTE